MSKTTELMQRNGTTRIGRKFLLSEEVLSGRKGTKNGVSVGIKKRMTNVSPILGNMIKSLVSYVASKIDASFLLTTQTGVWHVRVVERVMRIFSRLTISTTTVLYIGKQRINLARIYTHHLYAKITQILGYKFSATTAIWAGNSI